MLDRIFGSEKEEKIEKLKEELKEKNRKLKELKEKAKKEEKRAKEAITEKQKTDKDLKESQHKIKTLKDRIKKLEEAEGVEEHSKEVKFLPRDQLLSFVEQFGSLKSPSKSIITHYIENIEKIQNKEIAKSLKRINSETGFVYLGDKFGIINCVLVPPLPIENDFHRAKSFRLEKIREKIESNYRLGVVSVHAGNSIVGVLEGKEFTKFEIVESQVKGKHSKGGFSQGRFERGREKQIENHLSKIIDKSENIFEEIDYLILDGNQKMTSKLRDALSLDIPTIEKSLDIKKAKASAKKEYAEKIMGARLYIF